MGGGIHDGVFKAFDIKGSEIEQMSLLVVGGFVTRDNRYTEEKGGHFINCFEFFSQIW